MFSLVSRCFSPGVTLSFLFLSMACYVCVFHPEYVANPPPFSCWYCKGDQFFFGPLPWVLSGHLISMMFCRHLLINTCIVLVEVTVDLHVSDPWRKTDFTFELRFWFLLMFWVFCSSRLVWELQKLVVLSFSLVVYPDVLMILPRYVTCPTISISTPLTLVLFILSAFILADSS